MPTKYRLVDDDFKSKYNKEGVDKNAKQVHKNNRPESQARSRDVQCELAAPPLPLAMSGAPPLVASCLPGNPLNESAMKVLHQLETRGKFEYLFINLQTGNPYTAISKVWHRIRQKAGLEHLRLHDLRHAFVSFLINSGCSLFLVGEILGHSGPKVTQRYTHLSTKTLQEAANSVSAKIKKAMQPKETSKAES
ncbi:site-specific integrase [Nitrosomonas sp. Nm34]|uniref:tyrosine-type recombinase/integrase n=1 Tax=Nitrosomonas sp. Nm34 TaxID=1881055 RepID=UPI0008EE331B|nr:site-specific integrase [Nitrosomonas sp. Nm34]SFJ05798.1 Phage integrase family protein [Nitrosomonas sp. Nm34]